MPLAAGTPHGGAVTTFSDVTAFRKALEGVRHSEEKYRNFVESMPFMLLQVDLSGRVVYANPATLEFTGYELEDFADPSRWEQLVLPDYIVRTRAMLADSLAGRSSRGELRYRDKAGLERVAYAVTQPQLADGKPVGATTLLVDVTRERQLEQELERARRLELVGRLASGVAHDFNNLLSVVLGMSQLAGHALPADHPVHDDLRRITAAGEQASNLAAQLLSFARQQKVERHRVDINLVVRRTLDLLRVSMRHDIDVEETVGTDALFIEGDETQLQQVLMNLCLNARDAMPRGGRLRVQTAAESGDDRRTWIRLTVQDEGEGMTEQVKRNLFDPFFTTKETGSGLGLAVVQQIVEGHGGRIEVNSDPGRGARFDVWFPRAPD
jgi:PAS domain S-box-containing protein